MQHKELTNKNYSFSQYLAWITNETIPYPLTDWDTFTTFTRRFYTDKRLSKKANKMFKSHIRKVQKRVNTVNGKKYTEDPTIMSKVYIYSPMKQSIYLFIIQIKGWQIANEPQEGLKDWFKDISKYIKKGAPNQLVSTGIESKMDIKDFMNAHDTKYVDYCTAHCWVEK